jgi:hypothetical protein
MEAKEILKKIKAVFEGTTVLPAPAPAVPVKLATNYPVDNGGPVYADGTLDVGAAVWTDEAMTLPYPDGTYKVTGKEFSFTVAAGVISAVEGTLEAAPAPPAVLPMAPTLPQFEAMQKEVNDLKEELKKAKLLAEKHEKILPDLFTLAEALAKEPVSNPVALSERKQEVFNRNDRREQKMERIAQHIQNLKSK